MSELEVTVLGGVIGGVAVAGIVALFARSSATFPGWSMARITITPPINDLSPTAGVRYTVRKIRDGTDQLKESSGLQNKNLSFRSVQGRELVAQVRYRKKLGFQFKCYLDLPEMRSLQEVERLMFGTSWHSVSPDGTTPGGNPATRFWFLLEGYPICVTVDGYTNNLFTYRENTTNDARCASRP